MKKTSFDTYIEEQLKESPALAEKVRRAELALDIAYQIYELRQKKGLTQEELAELIGIKQSNIARLENAEYEGYSLRTLQKIAKGLDTNVNIILTSSEDTSSLLNSLYNKFPTITTIKNAGKKIAIKYLGGLSSSTLESVGMNSLFESGDLVFSATSRGSKDEFHYLNL